MSKMIQLRNVPDDLHRRLKECAASEGMSLSDFLTREARRIAERPTASEFREQLTSLPPLELETPVAALVRQERDRRSGDL